MLPHKCETRYLDANCNSLALLLVSILSTWAYIYQSWTCNAHIRRPAVSQVTGLTPYNGSNSAHHCKSTSLDLIKTTKHKSLPQSQQSDLMRIFVHKRIESDRWANWPLQRKHAAVCQHTGCYSHCYSQRVGNAINLRTTYPVLYLEIDRHSCRDACLVNVHTRPARPNRPSSKAPLSFHFLFSYGR